MKLKYKFMTKEVDGSTIAVAVGLDNNSFHGMIRLNKTGEFIFHMLNEKEVSQDEIVKAMMEKYDISKEMSERMVTEFIKKLQENELLEEV